MTLKLILLFSTLVLATSCTGQNASHVNSAITKGDTVKELADSILTTFQDRNNIYWFGSNGKGVYCYNGKSLIHYTKKHGLCHNQVRKIQEDKAGNIYFTTDGGVSKFDGQAFITLSITRDNSPGKGWKLQPDDLWFTGTQDSGVVYRYDGKKLYRLELPKTQAGEEHIAKFPRSEFPAMNYNPYDVYTIYRDRKGTLWFGTGTLGMCRYDGTSFSWLYEKHLTEIEGGGSFGFRSVIEDKKGKFWFCNTRYRYTIYPDSPQENGLINYTKEKGVDLQTPDGDDLIYYLSITEDNKGALWMVTYGEGVWRYDGENVTHYPVKKGKTIVTLFSIYKDNKGDLWVGTHTDGAYKFNGTAFVKFTP